MNVGALLVAISSFYGGAKALQQALSDDSVDRSNRQNQSNRRRRQVGGDNISYTDQPMVSKTYTVKSIGQRLGYVIQMIQKGRDNPEVRRRTVQMLSQKCGKKWCTPEKNWTAEVKAIFDGVRENIRYTRDTYNKDLFQHPLRTFEFGGGDCLPAGTLLLVEGHRFMPIEEVRPGTKIWGLDRWSTVGNVWYKGILPIDAIELNNGSWFKATADHKVYVATCDRHDLDRESGPCSCPIPEREIRRIHVSELTEKMVLLSPEKIPFGGENIDPRRARIEGLYLSDGWHGHPSDFSISGKDGHPKEEQKRLVEQFCSELGIPTTMYEKSICIRDAEWSRRVQLMGCHAPEKHALSINLDEGFAAEMLNGILADSGKNTNGNGRTFTSTSYLLALQTRMLLKMFGVSCSERYIEDHGGLGQNPIWRLGIRDQNRSDGHAEKLLRVKSIERNVDQVPVWDISTDDHYIYLPQADVTVSNCDDYSIVVASMLQSVGYPVRLRVIQTVDSSDWNHIYNLVGLPPQNPTKWMPLDASVDRPAGWQAPRGIIAAMKDFEVP